MKNKTWVTEQSGLQVNQDSELALRGNSGKVSTLTAKQPERTRNHTDTEKEILVEDSGNKKAKQNKDLFWYS